MKTLRIASLLLIFALCTAQTPDVVVPTPDVVAPEDAGAADVAPPADVQAPDDEGDAAAAAADDVETPAQADVQAPDEVEACPPCPTCPARLEAALSDEPRAAGTDERATEPTPTAGACLAGRLAPLLARAPLAGATVGGVVARLDDGGAVFAERATEALTPASTAKLVTSAAALHHLGPWWRWKTKIWSDAQRGDVIDGDVYVVGSGDPTLDEATLLEWAEAMRERGVARVKGDVVADGSAFAGSALPPGYDTKDTTATYRPAVAAFAVDRAILRAAIYPGDAPGEPCRVDLGLDAGYLDLENRCVTVAGGKSKPTLSSAAAGHRTRVVVGGKMSAHGGRILSRRRIEDPLLQGAFAFRAALERVGIHVDGTARTGTMPKGRRLRIIHSSEPLSVVLVHMNKHSDNFIAEMLLKTLGGEVEGWPATWEGGQKAVAAFIATLDAREDAGPLFDDDALEPGAWRFVNGSGLYPLDRLPPALLARIVREAALDVDSGPEFLASLPIAARDGTLRRRARKTAAVERARGKTGSLDGVDALAGVVTARDGVEYVYAFLVNGSRASHHKVRPALDRILAAIAEGCPQESAER